MGPGADPTKLGQYEGSLRAVAVLSDGNVVTGDSEGPVLAWDLAHPGTGPTELGRHDGWVRVAAALPDGRVVTGGDDGRVLAWDPAHPGTGPTAALGNEAGQTRPAQPVATHPSDPLGRGLRHLN